MTGLKPFGSCSNVHDNYDNDNNCLSCFALSAFSFYLFRRCLKMLFKTQTIKICLVPKNTKKRKKTLRKMIYHLLTLFFIFLSLFFPLYFPSNFPRTKHTLKWKIHIVKYPTSNAAENLVFKLRHAMGDGFSPMGALLYRLLRADTTNLLKTFLPFKVSSHY